MLLFLGQCKRTRPSSCQGLLQDGARQMEPTHPAARRCAAPYPRNCSEPTADSCTHLLKARQQQHSRLDCEPAHVVVCVIGLLAEWLADVEARHVQQPRADTKLCKLCGCLSTGSLDHRVPAGHRDALGLQQHSTWFACCVRYLLLYNICRQGIRKTVQSGLCVCGQWCTQHNSSGQGPAALRGHQALFAGAGTYHISIGKRHPLRLIKCTPIQVDSMYRRPPPTMTMPRPCITAAHGSLSTHSELGLLLLLRCFIAGCCTFACSKTARCGLTKC